MSLYDNAHEERKREGKTIKKTTNKEKEKKAEMVANFMERHEAYMYE